jgi:hypothetical protein
MKKKYCYLILICLISTLFSFTAQKRKYKIFIAEYDCLFTPGNECIDTINIKARHNTFFLKIYLSDCRGQMYLQCYDSNHDKIEEGHYINSLDLLKKYTNELNFRNMTYRIKVSEYYQPLRSGKWLFYNKSGSVLYSKTYKNGVLEDSIATN